MIEQEYKTIDVLTDGDRICLRIEDKDSYSGILNLCWLTAKEAGKMITALQRQKERLEERQKKIEEIIANTSFTKLYAEFEDKYNPYPVQMSRADAFSLALRDGLIDEDIYRAAHKYYGNLWFYVGD